MAIKILLHLFIILCYVTNGFAQNDTLFTSLTFDEDINTLNNKIVANEDGYCVLTYHFDGDNRYYSLNQVDSDFNKILSIDKLYYDNSNIIPHVAYLQNKADGDGYLMLANLYREAQTNLFVSIHIDKNLETVSLIDTLELAINEALFFRSFKYNNDLHITEGFGMRNQVPEENPVECTYVSFNPEGYFQQYRPCEIDPGIIGDFQWLPNISEYFISPIFDSNHYSIDQNFVTTGQAESNYDPDLPSHHPSEGLYLLLECDYNTENESVYCFGESGPGDPYASALVQISAADNHFLEIDTVYPFLPLDITNDDIVNGVLETDRDGNYVGIAVGYMIPINNAVEPNTLYFTKLTPDGEVLWNTQFYNGHEMMVQNAAIDNNNDIIAIGEYWVRENEQTRRRNFLLKIRSDGTISNLNNIADTQPILTVYPNPTFEILHISLPERALHSNYNVEIYNMLGQSVKKIENQQNIDVQNLPSGIYTLVLTTANHQTQYATFEKM